MNGLYSGTTSSQRAFSKYGMNPSALMTLAMRAIRVTPIMGETSTSAVWTGQRRIVERVERVAGDKRSTIRVADQHQGQSRANASPHVPHAEPDGGVPVGGAARDEPRRHGAVARASGARANSSRRRGAARRSPSSNTARPSARGPGVRRRERRWARPRTCGCSRGRVETGSSGSRERSDSPHSRRPAQARPRRACGLRRRPAALAARKSASVNRSSISAARTSLSGAFRCHGCRSGRR